MASLYVKYPKACRTKKSSIYLTPPVSSISSSMSSSSSGSLSNSCDGIKSTLVITNSSKRKQHYHYSVRSHKVSTMPKRRKLKMKKSKTSTSSSVTASSDSDTNKFSECRSFINNNAQDEINRNALSSTCKTDNFIIIYSIHYCLIPLILIYLPAVVVLPKSGTWISVITRSFSSYQEASELSRFRGPRFA